MSALKLELPENLVGAKPASGRKPRATPWTKPVYIKRLQEKIGTKPAADAVGVTDAAISEAIRNETATLRMENAAMGIWLRDHEERESVRTPLAKNEVIAVARLTNEQWEQLRPYLERNGIAATKLN